MEEKLLQEQKQKPLVFHFIDTSIYPQRSARTDLMKVAQYVVSTLEVFDAVSLL